MELKPWKIEYREGWNIHLCDFSIEIQDRIMKKIEQMKQPLQGRGLHHSRYQIEEVDQYRIAYIADEENRIKNIHFVGNHKQYEKWYTKEIGFHDSDVSEVANQPYLRFISLFSKTSQALLQQ